MAKNIPNKRPENHQELTKFFAKGIKNNSLKELQGVMNNENYIQGKNLRVFSKNNSSGVERIDGEELKYNYTTENQDRYVCIGSENINNHIMSFWASLDWSKENPTAGIICIDEKIVCNSVKLPFRHIHKLDIAKNENCLGGEIYITDNNLPPMYFSIKDMLDSYTIESNKYFSEFDYTNYTINLKNPTNSLVYKGLKNVGGANGLPVGQVAFSYRAVSNDGDKTNWSVPTPLIIIPRNYIETEPSSDMFKFTSTHGDVANNQSFTRYAPILKLRIDNFQGYNYIELKRIEYNNGQGIGYSPQAFIVQRIQIFPNQFSIIEIIDSNSNSTDRIPVAADDETNSISVIKRAEAIAYFKNKVILGNLEYTKRTLDNVDLTFREVEGEKATPMMHFLGEQGHRNTLKATYNKAYLNGEKYGFSIICWDDTFQRTFVYEPDNLKNFKFPDKRKKVSTYPSSASSSDYYNKLMYEGVYENSVFQNNNFFLTTQDDMLPSETFECVLHTGYSFKNKTGGVNNYEKQNRQYREKKELIANITQGSFLSLPTWNTIVPDTYGYKPRNPTSNSDVITKDRSYGANIEVFDGASWIEYKPDGFYPHYNALGLCIHGIEGFPDWVTAFSIARTKPANRVIAQGLGVYSMEEMGSGLITPTGVFNPLSDNALGHDFASPVSSQNEPDTAPPTNEPDRNLLGSKWYTLRQVRKDLYTIHCSFPDLETGLVSKTILDDIIKNPDSYKLQIVEPLGYFSEVLNGSPTYAHDGEIDGGVFPFVNIAIDQKIDLVTYARCQDEELMPDSQVGLFGRYSRFGGQRVDATVTGNFSSGQPNGYLFDIEKITINTDNEDGVWFLEIKCPDSQAFWLKPSLHGLDNNQSTGMYSRHYNFPEVKNFQECLYVVNLINTSAEISESSTKEFLSPLNYIKIESKIGTSKELTKEDFEIVDERLEDFYTVTSSDKKYAYVRKEDRIVDLRFINITNLSVGDIAIVNSDIDNGTTIFDGVVINGKFKASKDFISFDDTYSYTVSTINQNKLREGDSVFVKYDSKQQISIFGGEIMQNDAVFTYKQRRSAEQGVTNTWEHPSGQAYYVKREHYASQFGLGVGFPFMGYRLSQRIYKHHYYNTRAHVQEDLKIALNYIRQWIFIYTCQARSNLSYMYGEYFPNVNYVERPNIWNKNLSVTENKIFKEYEKDYPNEKDFWTSGGFKINMFNTDLNFNFDFSKEAVHDKSYSRKLFLQEEEQVYCTRLAWSQTRPIQNYGSPSLKTFRPFNYKDLSDKYGDIRKLTIVTNNNGDNLYALCENEIALVLTNKQTISGASGQILATTSTNDSNFLSQEIPMNVNRNKGLQRTHKWSFVNNGNSSFYANENGVYEFNGGQPNLIIDGNNERLIKALQEKVGVLRYANKSEGINLECLGYGYYDTEFKEYGFSIKFPVIDALNLITDIESPISGYEILDISDANNFIIDFNDIGDFSTGILNDEDYVMFMQLINNSTESKTYYVRKTPTNILVINTNGSAGTYTYSLEDAGLYAITIGQSLNIQLIDEDLLDTLTNLFVYCDENSIKSWTSEYDYIFDSVLYFNGKKYGFRDLKCYELEKGNVLNGENISLELTDVINPSKEHIDKDKEFIQLQVNTPTDVDKDNFNIEFLEKDGITTHATLLGTDMKTYGGLWQYIPRNENTGKRYQNNYLTYKIKYNGDKKIAISSVLTHYKILK